MALNFKPSAEAAKEAAAEITPAAEAVKTIEPPLFDSRKTYIRLNL